MVLRRTQSEGLLVSCEYEDVADRTCYPLIIVLISHTVVWIMHGEGLDMMAEPGMIHRIPHLPTKLTHPRPHNFLLGLRNLTIVPRLVLVTRGSVCCLLEKASAKLAKIKSFCFM